MTIKEIAQLSKFTLSDRFVSVRDIQKSPTKSLQWVKIIMNGSKPQGIYMDIAHRDEYIEDLEMVHSDHYKKEIIDSRLSWQISAEEVR